MKERKKRSCGFETIDRGTADMEPRYHGEDKESETKLSPDWR